MDIGFQFSLALTVKTSCAVAEMNVYILCLYQIAKVLVCTYATNSYKCYAFNLLFCFGWMFIGLKALVFVSAPARPHQPSPWYSV